MEHFDVAVIGQGYAGLSAAKHSVERGLRTVNFEVECMGGLIININELDPPAPGDQHCGAEIASTFAMGNVERGVVSVSDAVTSLQIDEEGLWLVQTDAERYRAQHVIVASGGKLRKLGIPGEEELFGQGVSECADCDGPMFVDMETVVVGGGDAAFQEAIALTEYASKVTVIIRGDAPRARAEFLERARANPKIELLTHTRVLEINGEQGKGVEGIRIETEGKGESTLACAGVFIFIGLEPNTGFLPADVKRDSTGALITSDTGATTLRNVWAVGAVRSGFGGLLEDAAADASKAIASLT